MACRRAPRSLRRIAKLPCCRLSTASSVALRADPALVGAVRHGVASSSTDPLPAAPAVTIYPDAVDEAEEAKLVRDAERWLKRKAFEGGHFDRVIVHYREVQKKASAFSPGSQKVIERLIQAAFPPGANLLPVHLLDLDADGYIQPHVDHVQYSGSSIVGLSLLTDAVMTLHYEPRGYHETTEADKEKLATEAPWLPLKLPRRSLYVLRGPARYEWAHAISQQPVVGEGDSESESSESDRTERGRRLALIFRDAGPG